MINVLNEPCERAWKSDASIYLIIMYIVYNVYIDIYVSNMYNVIT